MGERIRNAIFNSLAGELQGAKVLDAFAGTGSVGLEALSRGARHVTFIERDKIAQNILAKNIVSLGAENEAKLVHTSVSNYIATQPDQYYDIIFADPPYHDLQLSTVSRLMGLLKPNGLMVLSHTGKGDMPRSQTNFVVVDNRSYGNAHITFFRRVTDK